MCSWAPGHPPTASVCVCVWACSQQPLCGYKVPLVGLLSHVPFEAWPGVITAIAIELHMMIQLAKPGALLLLTLTLTLLLLPLPLPQGVPLTITLSPNASAHTSCATTAQCEGVVSGAGPEACQLALPCQGVFVLKACGQGGCG